MGRFCWYNCTLSFFTQDPEDHKVREAPLDLLATQRKLPSQWNWATTSPKLGHPSPSVRKSTMDRIAMISKRGILPVSIPAFMNSSSTAPSTKSLPVWIWCVTECWFFTHTPPGRPVTSQPVAAHTLGLKRETKSGWWPITVPTAWLVTATS